MAPRRIVAAHQCFGKIGSGPTRTCPLRQRSLDAGVGRSGGDTGSIAERAQRSSVVLQAAASPVSTGGGADHQRAAHIDTQREPKMMSWQLRMSIER